MLKKMRKKSVTQGIVWIIVCLILAGGAMFFSKGAVFKLFQQPVDLSTLPLDQIEGKYVTANVDFLFDAFAEMTEKNSKTNVEKSTEQYFVYPVVEKGTDNVLYYIGFQVKKADYSKAEKLVKETYAYQSGEGEKPTSTFTITGGITKMDSKVARFFTEYFTDSGASEEEVAEMAAACLLQENMVDGVNIPAIYIFSIFALIMILVAIGIAVYVATGGAQAKAKRYILAHSDASGLERAEEDCDNATQIGAARFGNEWIFFNKGTKTFALKVSELLWGYMHTVTTRTNGIKSGTSYGIILYTMDQKKTEINMKSEDNAVAALTLLKEKNPELVVGYNDQLKDMMKHDFEGFKAMARSQASQAQPPVDVQPPVPAPNPEENNPS